MGWLDPPNYRYPRKWSEYSYDYKLFFIWEIALFIFIFFGATGVLESLSETVFYPGLALYAVVLASLSLNRRRQDGWKWRGLTVKSVWFVLIATAAMAAFLYVFSVDLFPLTIRTVPMFLFALSICIFNVLNVLGFVQTSDESYLANCGTPKVEEDHPTKPSEPNWTRVARGIYYVVFLAVWLEGMTFFFIHDRFMKDSSPVPTATHSEAVTEHGGTFYFTHLQKNVDDILTMITMCGIPGIILSGFILHFVVGVPIFANMPKAHGLFGNRDNAN